MEFFGEGGKYFITIGSFSLTTLALFFMIIVSILGVLGLKRKEDIKIKDRVISKQFIKYAMIYTLSTIFILQTLFFDISSAIFIDFGFISISKYAACIMSGVGIGTTYVIYEGKKFGISQNTLTDAIIFGVPLCIFGARIYYVIFEWDRYFVSGDMGQTIINVCKLDEGGLGITGGIIVAIIFVYVFCKKKNINLLSILDLLAPGLLIGQICGRWGNFFNQEAHGGAIKNVEFMYKLLPDFIMDNMKIGSTYYHPTFLYESMWNFVGLVLIIVAARKLKKLHVGDFIGFYLLWYGFGRAVLIEPFRTDPLMLGDIRINVVIPALMSIGGLIYIIVKHLKFPQELYLDERSKERFEDDLVLVDSVDNDEVIQEQSTE